MKEKVTAFITVGCLFSLFFYYQFSSPNNETDYTNQSVDSVNEVVNQIVEEKSIKDNEISDSFEELQTIIKDKECSLNQNEIDKMIFSESFKYHRDCNGKGTSFVWRKNQYTTQLASEKTNVQLLVKNPSDESKNIIDLNVQKEIIDSTVGSK